MTEMQGRVLIVEDDNALLRSLRTTLDALGFDTGEAASGERALVRLQMADYEVVLLDINMPGIGGIETCRRMRAAFPKLQILMLTVRDSEDDKVEALEAGADDYITKPFQIRELIARIRAAIRRHRVPQNSTEACIRVGDVVLDPVRHLVEKSGTEIHLTPHEFNILHCLMKDAGRPIPYAQLQLCMKGSRAAMGREHLRVLIGELRKKLEDDPSNPKYVLTRSYVGYHFQEP